MNLWSWNKLIIDIRQICIERPVWEWLHVPVLHFDLSRAIPGISVNCTFIFVHTLHLCTLVLGYTYFIYLSNSVLFVLPLTTFCGSIQFTVVIKKETIIYYVAAHCNYIIMIQVFMIFKTVTSLCLKTGNSHTTKNWTLDNPYAP